MKMNVLFTTLAMLSAFCALAQFPTDGLIVHYPLRDNANDASGNGHHLNNKNVTFVPGAVHDPTATHAYFSGNKSYLYYNKSAYHAIFNLQDFTISGWARVDTMPNLYGNIFEIGETTFLRFFRPSVGNRRVQGGYRFGLGLDWITHNMFVESVPFLSDWHHYVLTSRFENDMNTMTLYLDGQFYDSFIEEDTPFILYEHPDSLLHIGGRPGANTLNLRGGLLDIFYYNRVLSPQEIGQLYQYTLDGPSQTNNPHTGWSFRLWPNPSNGVLHHNLPDGLDWNICDALGRSVMSGISNSTPLDISPLPPGWYAFHTPELRMAFYRY